MTDRPTLTGEGEQVSPAPDATQQNPENPAPPAIVTGNTRRDDESNEHPEEAQSQGDMDIDSIMDGPLPPITDSESGSCDEAEERPPPKVTRRPRDRRWDILEILAYDYFHQQYLVLWDEVESMNLTKTISWEPRANLEEDETNPRLLTTPFWKKRPKKAAKKFLRSVASLYAVHDKYSNKIRLPETATIKRYQNKLYKIAYNGVVLNKQDHEFSAQESLKLYWCSRKGAGYW